MRVIASGIAGTRSEGGAGARHVAVDPLEGIARLERQPPREQLVERDAEGIQVGPAVDRAVHPPRLLGRHVRQRPLDELGGPRGLELARQARREPEVGELHVQRRGVDEDMFPAKMRALLVRVGIDQAAGGWNAPVDPDTLDFVYVPIPESAKRRFTPGLATTYAGLECALAGFRARFANASGAVLPEALAHRNTHLDPDFDRLTYGDVGLRRGRALCSFERGDLVVFFAGLRPIRPCAQRLLYALIGVFRVASVARAGDVPRARWGDNAHTRRRDFATTDVIVTGDRVASGRLRRCIPIGEFRERAYRVRTDLLESWGGISARDGYIQRSAVPPSFNDPGRFLRWLEAQSPELGAANNPQA